MPEFINDVEQYIKDMTISTNLQPLPSTSSSPLSPETELTLQHTELHHEVDTTGTIHSVPVNAPLSCNHPCYRKACFECHHLGHIHIHCQWYICPICKVNQPDHPQHHCPLNHCFSWPSSSLLSSSSQPHPIPPPCSHSPPHSYSPLEDFEYDDVIIANMTSSPVSSYIDFWLAPFIRYPSPEFRM